MLQISNLDDQPGFAGFFIALLPAKVLYSVMVPCSRPFVTPVVSSSEHGNLPLKTMLAVMKALDIELRRAGSGRVSGACPGAGHLANASCVYVDTDYILWSG